MAYEVPVINQISCFDDMAVAKLYKLQRFGELCLAIKRNTGADVDLVIVLGEGFMYS